MKVVRQPQVIREHCRVRAETGNVLGAREKKSALEWCVPGRSGRMAELGEGTKTRQSKRNLTVEPRADSDLTSDSTLKGSRRKASW
jgi:hypothetical protein